MIRTGLRDVLEPLRGPRSGAGTTMAVTPAVAHRLRPAGQASPCASGGRSACSLCREGNCRWLTYTEQGRAYGALREHVDWPLAADGSMAGDTRTVGSSIALACASNSLASSSSLSAPGRPPSGGHARARRACSRSSSGVRADEGPCCDICRRTLIDRYWLSWRSRIDKRSGGLRCSSYT